MNNYYRPVLIAAVLVAICTLDIAPAFAADWSDPISIIRRREGTVVAYRAKLDSGYLVVEVKHGEGWHTYSMDNIERAKKKTGKEKPETELPTEIKVSGGIETIGSWYQTKPKDLSMTDIKWYTWGFENTALFAIKVDSIDGPTASVTVSAQACNANSCSMVDGQTITLNLPESLPESPADTPPLPEKSYVRVGDLDALKKL
ncbi:MAG TPA: hypothetical protein EYN96_06040 [Candidatus Hydrogenedentes bacterium]|nr:hypothetical protein [Candidatus Hydrogenedentota bacterium]